MAVVDGLTSPSWNSRRWWRWWEGEAEEVGGGGVGGYKNNAGWEVQTSWGGREKGGRRCAGFEHGEEARRGWNRRMLGTVAVEKRGFVHREDDRSCPTSPFPK